jgi:hypothetical protein
MEKTQMTRTENTSRPMVGFQLCELESHDPGTRAAITSDIDAK